MWRTQRPSRLRAAIYEAVFEAVYASSVTTDLGGSMTTTEFTDEVVRRVGAKLDVWSTIGK